MKLNKKSLLSLLTLAFCIFLLSAPTTVKAAQDGSSMQNAKPVDFGKKYTQTWQPGKSNDPYFIKFETKKRGLLTFAYQRPIEKWMDNPAYKHAIYTKNGSVVWSANSHFYDTKNKFFQFKIGLKAGTYYLSTQTNYYLGSDKKPVKSAYKLTFKNTNAYEIAGNYNKQKAMKLKLGKAIKGYYGENATDSQFDCSNEDWFKVSLAQGKSYTVTFSKCPKLLSSDSNVLPYLVYPDGTEVSLRYKFSVSKNTYRYTFKAPKKGTYYVRLSNDFGHQPKAYTLMVK